MSKPHVRISITFLLCAFSYVEYAVRVGKAAYALRLCYLFLSNLLLAASTHECTFIDNTNPIRAIFKLSLLTLTLYFCQTSQLKRFMSVYAQQRSPKLTSSHYACTNRHDTLREVILPSSLDDCPLPAEFLLPQLQPNAPLTVQQKNGKRNKDPS